MPPAFTVMSFLPYLKPGVLEKIAICEIDWWFMDGETMEQVALLEQWKQANGLQIRTGKVSKVFLKFQVKLSAFEFNEVVPSNLDTLASNTKSIVLQRGFEQLML